MNFFESEIVVKELTEMKQIHIALLEYANNYNDLEQKDRVNLLNEILELIEKQKIFFMRLSLSDDKDAQQIKEQIEYKMYDKGWFNGIPTLLDSLEQKINFFIQKETS